MLYIAKLWIWKIVLLSLLEDGAKSDCLMNVIIHLFIIVKAFFFFFFLLYIYFSYFMVVASSL